jgi:tRNA-Thr(GGU) m(6)t(6)A37 methyltransferase TsaA
MQKMKDLTRKMFCDIYILCIFLVGDILKEYKINPVAVIKNGYKEKFGVPRQSGLAPSVESEIVFLEDFRDENMIRDIEKFSHLWLIWGFSQNNGEWSPTVRPPKLGGNKRTGVFATRSPYRPNSLGLTVVKLNEVKNSPEGKILVVSGADLIDGTPIFDIKPYLPYVDSIPQAVGGFSDEHKSDFYEVVFTDESDRILKEIEKVELTEILSLNPRPTYQDDIERVYGLSFKDLSVKFRCEKNIIFVSSIERN